MRKRAQPHLEGTVMMETLDMLFGIGDESFDLNALQMAVRSVVIYVVSVLLVRIGNKRLMGRSTAFDLVIGIMLGSVLGRAITGQSPILPTIAAGAVLVAMHWITGSLAFHAEKLSPLVKGVPRRLIRDGEIDWAGMRKSHVGKHDLMEALRTDGRVTDPKEVELAYLERNGQITIIPKRKHEEPRIVEVKVEEGVQVVRLEIGN